MNLEETDAIITEAVNEGKLVARVHTGDPSIYGAIGEQIRELKKHDIEYEIIPGVSSLFGTASVLEAELTLPEISQSVIITRPEGRTPKPEGESLSSFSKHQYCEAIAYSDNGSVFGNWIHDERLLFDKDGGHGMIFTTYDGENIFIQHMPNNTPDESPCMYRLVEKDDTLYIEDHRL